MPAIYYYWPNATIAECARSYWLSSNLRTSIRHYLLGNSFVVRTDPNSLVWLLSFKRLEGQLARWQQQMAQFNMQIVHRLGGIHSNADGLSRLPETVPLCDCYQAGRNLRDLPCGGCAYCTKEHSQWERFCTSHKSHISSHRETSPSSSKPLRHKALPRKKYPPLQTFN